MLRDKLREYYYIATWSFIALASFYALSLRLYVAWDLPLWLDESWTAVLSSAPTFRSFLDQMWLDSNAPLYYFLMWLWPFEQTFWLRIPSFAFMIVASVIPIVWTVPGIDRKQAALWACLMLLWYPATSLFVDARYYSLLFALSTAQCLAFLQLDREPRLSRTMIWVSLATLCILTHYFAAILATAQGLYFLARHRGTALRIWPALLLTAPAIAWAMYHWPRLRLYGLPQYSWYGASDLRSALEAMSIVVGDVLVFAGLVVVALFFATRETPSKAMCAAGIPVLVATLSFALAGTRYPVFEPRYLIAMVPPTLLMVASMLRPAGYLPMAAWMFVNLGNPQEWKAGLTLRGNFGLELPARHLRNARSVTWMIDYPGSKLHVPWQMEDMLRDAFTRNGQSLSNAWWGTDFERGDALILIRRPATTPTIQTPSGWRCTTLPSNWGGHFTLVCARPSRSTGLASQ